MATQPTEIVRLNPDMYDKLEKSLPQPACSTDATPQQVGYLLGIQHVLRVLRQGWIVR